MRFAFLSLLAVLFSAVVLADDSTPATRPATQPSTDARPAAPVDRDAVLRALQQKEEEEEAADDEPEDADETDKSAPVIKPISPERIKAKSGRIIRANVNPQLLKWIDVDADGKPELVIPSWDGKILILKDVAGKPDQVDLEGLGQGGMVMDLTTAPNGKSFRWFLAIRETSSGFFTSSAKSQVALFDRTGERLWQFEMRTPKNYSIEMHVAAGDVDGDGACEYFAGVNVQKMRSTGNSSWTVTDQKAYLLVFNEQGKQIASRNVGNSLQSIQVVESPKPGEPGRVLVLGYDRIATFTFEPAKPPATQPGGP